jgi:hypothetical protein
MIQTALISCSESTMTGWLLLATAVEVMPLDMEHLKIISLAGIKSHQCYWFEAI